MVKLHRTLCNHTYEFKLIACYGQVVSPALSGFDNRTVAPVGVESDTLPSKIGLGYRHILLIVDMAMQ